MGINGINSMMEDLISNSPLQNSERQSPRKMPVKKLKQKQVPKSEVISITRHNREAGLSADNNGHQSTTLYLRRP